MNLYSHDLNLWKIHTTDMKIKGTKTCLVLFFCTEGYGQSTESHIVKAYCGKHKTIKPSHITLFSVKSLKYLEDFHSEVNINGQQSHHS